MVRSLMLSTLTIVGEWILICHPIPNTTINIIICIALLLLHAIMFTIACSKERQITDRLQMLEKKVDSCEENVYLIAKKQSGKIIEYIS